MSDLDKKLDAINDKVDSLVNQFIPEKQSLKHALYQNISNKAHGVKDVFSEACEKSKDVVEDTIRDKPFQTAAACLGIGLILGIFISRKK